MQRRKPSITNFFNTKVKRHNKSNGNDVGDTPSANAGNAAACDAADVQLSSAVRVGTNAVELPQGIRLTSLKRTD